VAIRAAAKIIVVVVVVVVVIVLVALITPGVGEFSAPSLTLPA